jgi:hypothetical protein
MHEITIIAKSPSPAPTIKSAVRFDVSPEAAQHNASLLREIDYNSQRFFQDQTDTTLAFGSEFLPVEQLRPLLRQHPGFDELAEMIVTGMPHHRCSREITEAEREQEVLALLTRGNHKSAQEEPEIVEQLSSKTLSMAFQWSCRQS